VPEEAGCEENRREARAVRLGGQQARQFLRHHTLRGEEADADQQESYTGGGKRLLDTALRVIAWPDLGAVPQVDGAAAYRGREVLLEACQVRAVLVALTGEDGYG
jgi:hypothetical protein